MSGDTSKPQQKNPCEIKFHNEYVKLMENLLKIFQEDKEISRKIKQSYIEYKQKYDRYCFIQDTLEHMSPFIDSIRCHDESIFCVDPECENENENENENKADRIRIEDTEESDQTNQIKPLLLLANLDFRPIWTHRLMEDVHKPTIWRYLQNLYLLGCHYSDKQDENFQKIIKQLKFDRILDAHVDKDEKEKDNANNRSPEDEQLYQDITNTFNELFGKRFSHS